jgi:hypothetical protein
MEKVFYTGTNYDEVKRLCGDKVLAPYFCRSLQDWQIRFSSPPAKLFSKQPSFPLELKGKEIPGTASEGTVVEVIITHFATFSSPVKT